MSEFLSAFGRVFLFCTFLPGLTGYVLGILLFAPFQSTFTVGFPDEWELHLALIYGIGFVANAIGHTVEVICELCRTHTSTGRFWKNMLTLSKNETHSSERLTSFYYGAENIIIWYWNSAAAISLVLLYQLAVLLCGVRLGSDQNAVPPLCIGFIVSVGLIVSLAWLSVMLRRWADSAIRKL